MDDEVTKLVDVELDQAVADELSVSPAPYSTDWAHGGPLLFVRKVSTFPIGQEWGAIVGPVASFSDVDARGPTPLIAGMRALVQHARIRSSAFY